jgi:hypothetical protein
VSAFCGKIQRNFEVFGGSQILKHFAFKNPRYFPSNNCDLCGEPHKNEYVFEAFFSFPGLSPDYQCIRVKQP